MLQLWKGDTILKSKGMGNVIHPFCHGNEIMCFVLFIHNFNTQWEIHWSLKEFLNAFLWFFVIGDLLFCVQLTVVLSVRLSVLFRQQVTEIIFVLKAISTLMDSLKKTQPENGEFEIVRWIRLMWRTGRGDREREWKTHFQINMPSHNRNRFSKCFLFVNAYSCLFTQKGRSPDGKFSITKKTQQRNIVLNRPWTNLFCPTQRKRKKTQVKSTAIYT